MLLAVDACSTPCSHSVPFSGANSVFGPPSSKSSPSETYCKSPCWLVKLPVWSNCSCPRQALLLLPSMANEFSVSILPLSFCVSPRSNATRPPSPPPCFFLWSPPRFFLWFGSSELGSSACRSSELGSSACRSSELGSSTCAMEGTLTNNAKVSVATNNRKNNRCIYVPPLETFGYTHNDATPTIDEKKTRDCGALDGDEYQLTQIVA